MPRTDLRHVVVGCGALGSAAAYWLSRALGARVLVLERDAPGRGADEDHARVLRYAQPRDAYAALAREAYATWRDVERVSGQTLVAETGGLVIEDLAGRGACGRVLGGHAAVADRHDVDFELLDARAVQRRWPQFRLAGTEEAMYQRRTGILDAARADATHLALARGHGAEVRAHSPVRALRPTAGHVEVVLDDEVVRAEHVVVAAEAGTNAVLDGLVAPVPLTLHQEQVTSYATPHLLDFSPARFPVFTWHGAQIVHGFPVDGEVATKLGHEASTDARRRHEFLAAHVPGFLGPEIRTRTRLSTIPPDGHPVVDTLPGEPRVSVGVGAGHASTFASLLGRVLAELATTGTSRRPIGSFALDRPALAAAA
ncbi:FAD-dependent oxidoreductase [Actinomycetospora lutea]|uniref:FAD-dependent oxidoreductase n=1 Tax=Actinomycetospora lutea TaxID=663604 RepID=UPI00236608D7|nr:FAD-dependent oxidoreductase [Actinomycetospora lutea]MDD7942096.1 FAD-dependent oxidoreductase [Actinomycetospora lutea]